MLHTTELKKLERLFNHLRFFFAPLERIVDGNVIEFYNSECVEGEDLNYGELIEEDFNAVKEKFGSLIDCLEAFNDEINKNTYTILAITDIVAAERIATHYYDSQILPMFQEIGYSPGMSVESEISLAGRVAFKYTPGGTFTLENTPLIVNAKKPLYYKAYLMRHYVSSLATVYTYLFKLGLLRYGVNVEVKNSTSRILDTYSDPVPSISGNDGRRIEAVKIALDLTGNKMKERGKAGVKQVSSATTSPKILWHGEPAELILAIKTLIKKNWLTLPTGKNAVQSARFLLKIFEIEGYDRPNEDHLRQLYSSESAPIKDMNIINGFNRIPLKLQKIEE